MTRKSITITDGPDKPALQWAVLYPERGQNVMFRTENEVAEARVAEMGSGKRLRLRP